MRSLGALRWRPVLLSLVPGLVIAQNWLRLERSFHDGARTLLLVLLAVAPALAPRLWQRLLLLVPAAGAAAMLAARVPLEHPARAATRFWNGFLDFYDVRLPFSAAFHPHMHALVLLAAFGFTAALALAASSRRPLTALLVLVVGAGWPATLLAGGGDIARGAAILAAGLLLIAGLRSNARRTLGRAALVACLVVGAAVVATTRPAVAKSEFLHWQTWDPYTRPAPTVSVRYVWDATYTGFRWPKKETTVLKVHASARSLYWRATTLDLFTGTRWVEALTKTRATLFSGRLDLTQADPLATPAARDPAGWNRAEVEVEALADNHLVAPSVPVAYRPSLGDAEFWRGGVATLSRGLERGEHYLAWSYSPQPNAAQLAAVRPRYPAAVAPYLELAPGLPPPPPFATPGRQAAIVRLLALHADYRPLYEQARRVVGHPRSPYAAVLALESWLRTTGGFSYTTQPPPTGPEPLLDFVLRTKRGYCQHFAGAMALMLRYLGIPARVAEGFVSGTYDPASKTWTVTDHDAHAWVEVWFPRFGWLPFDPTPGRGTLSAPYSISSPGFRDATAARLISGTAALLLNTAAVHQDVSFGDKDTAGRFLAAGVTRQNGSGAGAFGLDRQGGSLGKLLALLAALVLSVLVLLKAVRRRLRYAAASPRRRAAACRLDLRDFLADQGIELAPSATPDDLVRLLRAELEVDAEPFAAALAAARFGPAEDAVEAAARARDELGGLRAQLRRRLGIVRRARGLASLRSLGFAG